MVDRFHVQSLSVGKYYRGAGEGMDWVFTFVEKYQQMSSSHDILDIRRDGGNLKAKIQIAKVQNV